MFHIKFVSSLERFIFWTYLGVYFELMFYYLNVVISQQRQLFSHDQKATSKWLNDQSHIFNSDVLICLKYLQQAKLMQCIIYHKRFTPNFNTSHYFFFSRSETQQRIMKNLLLIENLVLDEDLENADHIRFKDNRGI